MARIISNRRLIISREQAVKCSQLEEVLAIKVSENGDIRLVYLAGDSGSDVIMHVFSGWPIPRFPGAYHGTFMDGYNVWHVFEAAKSWNQKT